MRSLVRQRPFDLKLGRDPCMVLAGLPLAPPPVAPPRRGSRWPTRWSPAASSRFASLERINSQPTTLLVITDDGVTGETVEEYEDMSGFVQNVETLVDLDLSPWAGPLWVACEFDNGCGDTLGVEWGIDDVQSCEQNALPS